MKHLLLKMAFTLALVSVSASSPTAAASFDCTKTQSAAEKAICADASLSALDKEMAAVYTRAHDAAQDPETIAAMQKNWLAERDRCANTGCLYQAYTTRIAQLADYADALHSAGADAAVFVPRDAADKACPRIVMPDAPNVAPDCTVADWLELGQVGPHFRGYSLYRVRYAGNGQTLVQHIPALWTLDENDPAVLRLDVMMLAVPGLAGEVDDVAALRPMVERDVISLSFPRLDGTRENIRFDARGNRITSAK